MLFRKTILSLITLFMAVSGMPVYAEEAPAPEVTEQKDDAASTETGNVLGIKKLYAEEPKTLTTGSKFNSAIKTLAAGANIQQIQVVNTPPSGSITTKDVSANNDGAYLAWWDADAKTIYLYSKSGDIVLNPNSSGMFQYCSNLTALNISNWNTSQVTDMSFMFANCGGLTALNLSGWDTSKVTGMKGMFSMCHGLTALDVSRWNTGSVTNMYAMFAQCSRLTTLDVSKWDTSQVTNMNDMFSYCFSLPVLDLSKWNTSQVTSMDSMFAVSSPTRIYIGDGWNTDNVTSSENMFRGCTNLPNFNYDVVDKTNANADPDTGYMSYKVEALKYLKDSSFVLSGTSDYGNSINMVVSSDKNGRLSFKNLEKGTYTLTEISPTDGYIKNSGKYTVTVTDSGVSVVSDNPDFYYETEDQKVLFNEPYHSFMIQKTSSVDSTVGVEGAEFLLSGVSDYGTEVSRAQTTGKTGVATFDHLEAGSYLLTETKAPEHFALDPISRIVTISKYGVVKIDGLSKEGSSFVWTDIRNADGTITITKNWKDTLTGTDAANRALPIIVISDQRTIPDAVTVTYYAGDGYFGTEQTNETNAVTYTEKVDRNGSILSVSASKGQEMIPSMTGKMFDAWYLDSTFTNKAPDSISDYIKANPSVNAIPLYAKYKDPPMLTTGWKFNSMIKSLADKDGKMLDFSQMDSLIKAVQVEDTPPSEGITTWDVSAKNDGSYLAWWDADTSTIKLYSKSGSIVLNPDSNYMFYRCTELATLDASKWDTSQVTNMSSMFDSCGKLTTLDVSKWNTSNVTNMSNMFSDCSSLAPLDVSGWDTSRVTNMSFIFKSCNNLTALTVSSWNTSIVTDMSGMFSDSGLTTLDVSNWDTSKVTNMSGMFAGCSSLTTLNASNWNTSQVTNMNNMFSNCSSLTTLDVSRWNTSQVTDMSNMFAGCSKLTTLDISKWDTSKVTSMSYIFYGCSKLTTLDVSKWNTGSVTNMSGMFWNCKILTTLDVSGWNTRQVTNMRNMFLYCSKLATLDVSKWDTSKVTDMDGLFQGCSKLTTLDVSKWNTGSVTNMSSMFYSCSSLTTLDVSKWNTSQVTNMRNMFLYCSKLATLDVSKWDTSKVTDMDGLFQGCSKLTTLDVSKWNTGSVTNMNSMFKSCSNLTTLDVSGWDTSKVTNMYEMLRDCTSLTTLDVSGWDTSKVRGMGNMFAGCSNLPTLDLSGWDTSQVKYMDGMFNDCSSLEHIYIGSGWNTDNVTSSDDMFYGCTTLHNFNSSVIDKTNANADPDTGYMEMADRFKVPYSVYFDKNAVDASGTMGEEAFTAGEKKNLAANSYSREGFVFSSWNTKADGTGKSFADGAEVSYLTTESSITLYAQWRNPNIAYSHTSNIDDNGTQNSNYGNNWSNANITGTDRGDTSKAHVVTLPGAKKIKVTITFGGEGASWDYACVWEGAHPDYTAASNYSTSISGRLGGGSHTDQANTKTYTVTGDTVTFGFKSDGSNSDDGYGYYAVVEKVS